MQTRAPKKIQKKKGEKQVGGGGGSQQSAAPDPEKWLKRLLYNNVRVLVRTLQATHSALKLPKKKVAQPFSTFVIFIFSPLLFYYTVCTG